MISIRKLFTAFALLALCISIGTYQWGFGESFSIKAQTQQGLATIPAETSRECYQARLMSWFYAPGAARFAADCNAFYESYRSVAGFNFRFNLITYSGIAAIGFFFLAWLAMQAQEETAKVIRGPQYLKERKSFSALKRVLKQEAKISGKGLDLIPGLPLSRDRESRHFLIWGGVGTGKTQTMWHLILGALKRGDGVLVLDVKGDMTAHMPTYELALLAPQDRRSLFWDVAKDCATKQDAHELAARIIPASSDPMWSDAARGILVACIGYLQATKPGGWTWKDLFEATTASTDQLADHAANYNPNALRTLDNPESKTTQSILSTFQTHMKEISMLSDAWGENGNDGFSIREWIKNPTPLKPVILQRDGQYQSLSDAWIGGIISLLAAAVASPSLPENRQRRIWLFLDEFPQLPRMDHFSTLLDLGRSKGVITVIGAQDMDQIRATYGPNKGNSWMSMTGTQILTGLSTGKSAQEMSQLIGQQTVEKTVKSRTRTPNGVSTSYHTQTENKPVITANEIVHRLKNLKHAVKVLALNIGEDLYELSVPILSFEKLRPASEPAAWTKPGTMISNTSPEVPLTDQPDASSTGAKLTPGMADAIRGKAK